MIHKDLWSELSSLDPEDVCRRSGALAADKGFLLPVLNRHYLVNPSAETFVPAPGEPARRPSLGLELSGVQYLIHARPIPLAGELATAEQFDGGGIFFRGVHEMPTAPLAERFGDDTTGFAAVAAALGGRREPYGDEAATLDLFPRLPVTVALWAGDKEFPARATILFDRTAGSQMPLDALLAATGFLVDELTSGPTGADRVSCGRR